MSLKDKDIITISNVVNLLTFKDIFTTTTCQYWYHWQCPGNNCLYWSTKTWEPQLVLEKSGLRVYVPSGTRPPSPRNPAEIYYEW